jgi:2-haloacid dehalogenase
MIVLFDLLGTLLTLDRARGALVSAGAPGDLLGQWLDRLQQNLFAGRLAGRHERYSALAEATLRQVLAARRLPDAAVPDVLEAMLELDPRPDAAECLLTLRDRGHALCVLTNTGADAAQALLDRAGLARLFTAVVSAEEAGLCKPQPAAYRFALERAGRQPEDAALVAAHAWDVQGAAAAGLRTVWVGDLERRWPYPGDPPGAVAASIADVPDHL